MTNQKAPAFNHTSTGNIANANGVAVGSGATAVHVNTLGDVGDVVTGTKLTLINQVKERVAGKHQVAAPTTDYFPRPIQEEALSALLTAKYDGFRTVFLHGAPGVGKSWLARRVVSELKDAFPDGILFADLQTTDIRTAVWNFIEPFDESISRTSLSNPAEFTAALEAALSDKRVLILVDNLQDWRDNWQGLRNWLPYSCDRCVALLVVPQLPESLQTNELDYAVGGLSLTEAVEFLSLRLMNDDGSARCDEKTVTALAEALAFSPKAMSVAARDIAVRQIDPEEYLAALQTGKQEGGITKLWPELEANYQHLPPEGQALLPFLGLFSPWPWAIEDMVGVTLRNSREIEVGLAQLQRHHMVDCHEDSHGHVRYQTPAIVKDFSLDKLAQLHGQQLIVASKALHASNALRSAELVLNYARQSMLAQAWTDNSLRQEMIDSVSQQFNGEVAKAIRKSTDTNLMAVPINPLEAFFEDVVLVRQPYLKNWLATMNDAEFALIRSQLEAIFDWAVEMEDWPLVRRFANRLGVNTSWIINTRLAAESEGQNWTKFGFTFALLKHITADHVEIRDVVLKGSTIKETQWTDCQFVANEWPGAKVIASTFTGNDMVGFSLPGGVITGCTFRNVDARFADFRGTIFQQCEFSNVNFRSAKLENAKLIDCILDLDTVDLRATVWEEPYAQLKKEQPAQSQGAKKAMACLGTSRKQRTLIANGVPVHEAWAA